MTNDQLNVLQDHGIISDLVVHERDIAPPDRERAAFWLTFVWGDEGYEDGWGDEG